MRSSNGPGGIGRRPRTTDWHSKKTTDVIAKFQPEFIKGPRQGLSKEQAEEILIDPKFGGYGLTITFDLLRHRRVQTAQ
jgi:hypothetical protein